MLEDTAKTQSVPKLSVCGVDTIGAKQPLDRHQGRELGDFHGKKQTMRTARVHGWRGWLDPAELAANFVGCWGRAALGFALLHVSPDLLFGRMSDVMHRTLQKNAAPQDGAGRNFYC